MRRVRVIPVLLIHNRGIVKSVGFKNYTYVGDPINAVKIFNNKEVDEIVILDIDATREGRGPDFSFIAEITSEAFIPLAYGGGISTIEQIQNLFYLGVEKVILNHSAYNNLSLITEASNLVGSQSIVVSIDVRKNIFGKYHIVLLNGTKTGKVDLLEYAQAVERAGAGEIFLNAVNRDGTFSGYDVELIKKVSEVVKIPVVACGGADSIIDFKKAIDSGASAVAAGSMFVFQKPHRAVLISYPSQEELTKHLYEAV